MEPVLADLGRIESALGVLALDQNDRERVGRRLRGLLARFDADRAAPAAADVETASDEEMFKLIDKQLRSS